MNRSPRLQTLGISLRVKLGVHTLRLTLYVHLEGFEALGLGPNLFNLGTHHSHSHSHHILSYISTRISMCSRHATHAISRSESMRRCRLLQRVSESLRQTVWPACNSAATDLLNLNFTHTRVQRKLSLHSMACLRSQGSRSNFTGISHIRHGMHSRLQTPAAVVKTPPTARFF